MSGIIFDSYLILYRRSYLFRVWFERLRVWFVSQFVLCSCLRSCLVRLGFGVVSGPVRVWVRGEFVISSYLVAFDLYLIRIPRNLIRDWVVFGSYLIYWYAL